MNTIIFAAAVAWLLAQFTKILCGLLRYGSRDKPRMLWRLIWAGGMPSAHSALITACAVVLLLSCGPHSSIFGLTLVMACIVIYDRSRMFAIYRAFQERYPALKRAVLNDPMLKDLVGHRLSEIAAGVFIGLCSGFLTMNLFSV